MRQLFSPCTLGPLSLRNPMAFLPFFTAYADEKGLVNDPLLRHYDKMAASGVGLVVVEAALLRHCAGPHGIAVFSDEHLPGLEKLAAVIRKRGAKAVLQICHPGRFAFRPDAMAPSAVAPFGNPDFAPRAMTEADMDIVEADFAEAARLVQKAGFDGVELHGGTGYLLASFLSPHTNRRDDAYGGSLKNRIRFPLRVCRAVRAAVGDYPVGYRFMAREYVEGGLTIEEGTAAAALLARDLGPAYVSVMVGQYECFALLAESKKRLPAGYMLDEAKAVKTAAPQVPVIAAGHMQTAEICIDALEAGIDAIGLGRVLFADADWLRKIEAGAGGSIRACVQCNTCQKQVAAGRPVFCSRWGKEEKAATLAGIPAERQAKPEDGHG